MKTTFLFIVIDMITNRLVCMMYSGGGKNVLDEYEFFFIRCIINAGVKIIKVNPLKISLLLLLLLSKKNYISPM